MRGEEECCEDGGRGFGVLLGVDVCEFADE